MYYEFELILCTIITTITITTIIIATDFKKNSRIHLISLDLVTKGITVILSRMIII